MPHPVTPPGAGTLHRNQFEHAATLLERVLGANAPADVVMNGYFRSNPKMGGRDRSFAAETVFTVLRQWRRLEAIAGRSDPRSLVLAFLAAQGAPPDALSRVAGGGDALRWLTSLGPRLAHPVLSPAAESGFPDWVFERLARACPEGDVVALGLSLQQPAPLDLRVNPLRMTREEAVAALQTDGIDPAATPFSPVGLRLARKVDLRHHALFTGGALEVQDEGSQLLAYATDPQPGERVVDFCAGAGGKTLLMGALMRSHGTLYAFDVSAPRLHNLTPRLRRSGLSNVHPRLLQAENDVVVKRLRGTIDRVLVDAPCSGLGTLRRNPDLKWRHSPQTVAELVAKQDALLRAAARLVKPGGRVVYATCSLLPEENEEVVRRFLDETPDFDAVPPAQVLAGHGIVLDTGRYLQLRTHRHRTDSFFAAILQRHQL